MSPVVRNKVILKRPDGQMYPKLTEKQMTKAAQQIADNSMSYQGDYLVTFSNDVFTMTEADNIVIVLVDDGTE